MHIFSEKHFKLDIYKNQNGIFIGYINTIKDLKVWAPKTH